MNKKRVVIYCRVSSEEQKKKDTIEGQLETLRTYLDNNKDKYTLVREYLDNGVTGTLSFKDREGGKKLLEDAVNLHDFDSILIYKIDRLARDTLVSLNAIEEITKLGLEVISLSEPFNLNTPTGRFQFQLYSNMAELDRANILERMHIGTLRSAKNGKWLGGVVPYGFTLNKEGKLDINILQANVVRYIYYLYIEKNKGMDTIAGILNDLGVVNLNGSANGKVKKSNWSVSLVNRILNSSIYYGLHRFGERSNAKNIIDRNYPPIVPVEVFEAAKKKRQFNKKMMPKNTSNRVFLLRGKIICGKCGKPYYGHYYSKKNDVYFCSGKNTRNKKLYNTSCDNLNVSADDLENYVWESCKNVIINFDKLSLPKNNKKEKNDIELKALKNKYDNYDKEKNNILKLFRKELISEDELNEQLADIKKEYSNILNRINELNSEEIDDNIYDIKSLVDIYKNKIEKADPETKMRIINILIKYIEINRIEEEGVLYPHANIVWTISTL